MNLLAAFAAGLACWVLLGPDRARRLSEPGAAVLRGDARRLRLVAPGLAVAVGGVVGWLVGGAAGAAIAVATVLPGVTAVVVWRHHRKRADAEIQAKEVLGACQLLAGLLRVGHVPAAALRTAAQDAPILAEAAASLQIGGPVGSVLRRQGATEGRSGLVELGVAWDVAERTGASLTATLDALAERLAARQAVRNVVAAELSAPRATGRLLAVLPVAGVLLGYSFGGDPLSFLGGSLPGQLSLVVGVALGCAGVFWTERIADAGSG